MHYVDEFGSDEAKANASPLLLVHGNPTWSFYYRSLIESNRSKRRVVAVDHIGCGLSDKPLSYTYDLQTHTKNLVDLVDSLDLKNITLVVHDWGGAIGLGAAIDRLDRFSRILVLNTGAFPPPYVPWRIAALRFPILGSLAIRYGNVFALAAVKMAIDRLPKLAPIARAGLLAPYDSPAHRVAIDQFVRDIPMSKSHKTYAVLERLESNLKLLQHLPIRFVWGMKDWCFTAECMERMKYAWPNAVGCELRDVGHYVMEEAPDEVARELELLMLQS